MSACSEERRPVEESWWDRSETNILGIRYLSLLYTGFFFISPYYQHSLVRWLGLALFFAVFLALYFSIPKFRHRPRVMRVLFVLFFLIGFAYYPFNISALGSFVFPVVMVAFVVKPKTFLWIMSAQIAGIAIETWLLHIEPWAGAEGVFFVLAIGGSNLFYAQQQRTTALLRKANGEIEHLAQTAERERIARDLHDLLGHTLTLIALKSELAQRIAVQDPRRAQIEMAEVEQTARKALAEVRETVLGYRSDGLPAEIGRARQALSSAGVDLTADLDPVEVGTEQGTVLSLAMREAVTNIVRHAGASACRVELRQVGSSLCFAVEDNGRGWAGREGNGLSGMRERVSALGGEMLVGRPGTLGMRIDVKLPLLASGQTNR